MVGERSTVMFKPGRVMEERVATEREPESASPDASVTNE